MLRFYGFYLPLEQTIQSASARSEIPFAYAPRAGLIAQDLVDLDLPRTAISQAPACRSLERIVTPQTLGGVIYVIEGSTLGANPIDRAAQHLLAPDNTKGRGFWAWSRAQNKQRWSLATAYLERLSLSTAPISPMVTGASEVFEALGDWLAPLDTPVLETSDMAS